MRRMDGRGADEKKPVLTLCLILLLAVAACGGYASGNEQGDPGGVKSGEKNMTNVSITVGKSVFSAKFYDNKAARALLAQFPQTFKMGDLNGNEKFFYLAADLPSVPTESPATINAGDIMCWSGNCLVLFYKTFSNSYGGYIRLGYVEDVTGLAAALGGGNAEVAFTIGE